MTTLYPPKCSTQGSPTCSDAAVLRAALIGTTSYVATDDMVCLGWHSAVFAIGYKNGAEDSYEVQFEGWNGIEWIILAYKAVQGSGVSVLTTDPVQLVKATYSTRFGAATRGAVSVPPLATDGYSKIRAAVKLTGTPGGLVDIACSLSLVPVLQ